MGILFVDAHMCIEKWGAYQNVTPIHSNSGLGEGTSIWKVNKKFCLDVNENLKND